MCFFLYLAVSREARHILASSRSSFPMLSSDVRRWRRPLTRRTTPSPANRADPKLVVFASELGLNDESERHARQLRGRLKNKALDVVFIIDSSGSMQSYDPQEFRKRARRIPLQLLLATPWVSSEFANAFVSIDLQAFHRGSSILRLDASGGSDIGDGVRGRPHSCQSIALVGSSPSF